MEEENTYDTTFLNELKNKIEGMNNFNQIEVLRILKSFDNVTLNENTNGNFVNLTYLPNNVIEKLKKYAEYVENQEKTLNSVEQEKENYKNKFFNANPNHNHNPISENNTI